MVIWSYGHLTILEHLAIVAFVLCENSAFGFASKDEESWKVDNKAA